MDSPATATTTARQRPCMNHEKGSVRIDQINHLHETIALSAAMNMVFDTTFLRETSRRIVHHKLNLRDGAAVQQHLFDVPFDPAKIVENGLII